MSKIIDFSVEYGIPDIKIIVTDSGVVSKGEPKQKKEKTDDEPTITSIPVIKTFYFSRMTLWRTSDYFKALLSLGEASRKYKDVVSISASISEFNLVLNYLWDGKLVVNKDNAIKLYLLFDMFLIGDPLKDLSTYIYANVDPNDICKAVIDYGIPEVKKLIDNNKVVFAQKVSKMYKFGQGYFGCIIRTLDTMESCSIFITSIMNMCIVVDEISSLSNIFCRWLVKRDHNPFLRINKETLHRCFSIISYCPNIEDKAILLSHLIEAMEVM